MPNVQLTPGEAPPPDYYRSNLLEVCRYVLNTYPQALRDQDVQWLRALLACTQPAQRLLARLVMRKGPLFRLDKLSYREVGNVHAAAAELAHAGLALMNPAVPADQLLALLVKAEVADISGTSGRKQDLVLALLSRKPDELIRKHVAERFAWLRLTGAATLDRTQLLYFGHTSRDLSAFVMRDLGLTRYEHYEVFTDRGPFNDRRCVDEYLRLTALRDVVHTLDTHPQHASWLRCAALQERPEFADHRAIERRRNKLLNTLGRWGERAEQPAFALDCYRHSRRHPARERMVRMLARHQQPQAAEQLLEAIRNAPLCAPEAVFAERFGKRNGGFQPPVTVAALRDPNMHMTPGAIESEALAYFAEAGAWGVHLENALPLSLAGLAYWGALFAPVPGAFSNPMQNAPNDLYWEDFVAARADIIAECTRALEASPARLVDTWQAKHGIACALVNWQLLNREVLQQVIAAVPGATLASFVRETIHDLTNARTGFPDLFIVHQDGTYEFVEVKGPNDALQPQQRAWFARLRRLGMPARVLKFKA